jgi:hypothetical protein
MMTTVYISAEEAQAVVDALEENAVLSGDEALQAEENPDLMSAVDKLRSIARNRPSAGSV